VIVEVGSGYRREKPARGKIRPLGCRELRAPTWRKSNEPLCRSPAPAGSADRRVDQFHPASCTGVSVFVQCQPTISAVSLSRRGRSDYEYFSYPAPGPDSLDSFLRREPSRDRCLSLRGFDKNPEQFGIETSLKAPNPCKARSVRQCRPDSSN